jgi:hypothetical protein
MTEEEK